MTHNGTTQALLDAAPLVPLGSYDLLGTPEQALAFAQGEVTLMPTKTGLSTILVDKRHNIVGHAGLADRPDIRTGAGILATGGNDSASAAAHAVWPGVVAIAGVVILGVAGSWYFVHKRKRAEAATGGNQAGVAAALAEAEDVVDAELARLSRASHDGSPRSSTT